MPQYKHIFFDLDHTLWDFATNASLTLGEVFIEFKLADLGIETPERFLDCYTIVNDEMWAAYRKNEIDKETLRSKRFELTLAKFGVDNPKMAEEIGDYYIYHSPRKTTLFPHAIETLNYLKERYQLHIITNGFKEVQAVKMEKSNLNHFFDLILTSEEVGVKKPDQKIFLEAMKLTKASRKESIMIGDNLMVDIVGARRVGMDQVYFNPHKDPHGEEVTHEIRGLEELMNIL